MSYVAVEVDTSGPAEASVTINGGLETTEHPLVSLLVQSWDYLNGQQDVREMKVWGDVDPADDPLIATTEGASEWFAFTPTLNVLLSSGAGTKTVRVKVRDSVGNSSSEVSATIALALPSIPVVTVISPPRRKRFSTNTGYNSIVFSWRADRTFAEYQVRAVGSLFDAVTSGALISGTNTAGTGSYSAPITTTIPVANLLTASSGDGGKIIKVFVRVGSVWSV